MSKQYKLFTGEGAKGGCYFTIQESEKEGVAFMDVGWSCVCVYDGPIHITWLAEMIAIAMAHEGGIKGFLEEHDYGGESYALMCDPDERQPERDPDDTGRLG